VADFVGRVLNDLGIPLLVYYSFRDYPLQWELRKKYLAGGAKAAAPGYSWHNFGRAVDVVPILPSGVADWNSPRWNEIIAIAKSYGLSPGADFGDTNHFSNREGASLSTLRANKPVPLIYKSMDRPDVPKEVEVKKPPLFPVWMRWTAAGVGIAFLAYHLITKKK